MDARPAATASGPALLPCPFCGCEPFMQRWGWGGGLWSARVVCSGCHASTASAESERVWRRRGAAWEDATQADAERKAADLWNGRRP